MSPRFSPARRRWTAIAAAITAATLALTGCASAGGSDGTPEGSTEGYPVAVDHVYGTTTIESEPQRIVTLGWQSQDVLAALGTVPVGTTDFTWGSVDKYLPWFEERVEELGGELPEIVQFTDAGGLDYEQILGLDPDLILAMHSGITDVEYERLTEIAPTVAYAETAWASDWKEVTTTIGDIMGKSDEAQKLVDDTDAYIDEQAAAHPEFDGVVLTYGWYLADGATALDFYLPIDPRVQVMEQLGFVTSPQVIELGETSDAFYEGVSLEELDSVESEFHLAWSDTPADETRTLENPLVARWAPIAAGHYYFIDDQALAWASSQPSVLSIPWSLDELLPAFSEALAK